MSGAGSRPDVAAHLRAQHDRLGAFVALLERERAVLGEVPVSIDALGDITGSKQTLAAELERMEAVRRAMLADAGYAADLAGGAAQAQAHDCEDLWYAFIAQIETARIHNQLNGLAVHNRLELAQRSLEFLRRASATTLYAANGHRHASTGQRIQSGA